MLAAAGGCTSGAGDAEPVATGGAGNACLAGSACTTLEKKCTDSYGSSCECIEKVRQKYLVCAPAPEASGGSGGEAGGGSSGGPAVDPTSGTKACAGDAPWTTGVADVALTIEAGQRVAAWSRFYEKGVAADHANTILSTAWGRNIQNALKKGHDLAGFEYARFHGILNDDIGVYAEKSGVPVYDWTRFDQVYDAVLAAGMRPVVEIGFTPPPLASSLKDELHWYGGVPANISQPKDWVKWRKLMAAIVQHLEQRYGVEEVRNNWFFEVWNEASWMYTPGESAYPELYYRTVSGLLAGDPEVKVGGPAGSAASSVSLIPNLVNFTKSNDLELDFVTWHRYGNDEGGEANRADANGMLAFHERLAGIIEDTGFQGLSLNDEWGPSYDPHLVRDNEVAASFVAKTVHLIGTSTQPPPYMFGYWTISDLYEEINTGNALAYRQGNYGLFLKGDADIPISFDVEKPAFNAFRMLHLMGDVRLASSGGTVEDGVNVVATAAAGDGAVQVLVYNHVNGGEADATTSELVSLTVNELPFEAERVSVRHYMVDRHHSNSHRAWLDMGAPKEPTEDQWTALADAAALCYYETSAPLGEGGSWTVTYPQNVYGVSLFVITPE